MDEYTVTLFPHPNFAKEAALFAEKYDLWNCVIVDDTRYSRRSLKGYSNRTCRFCQRSHPEARFSNYSHLVPQLIGNTNLYSDFECDDCNALFSGYEDDLAAYLAISRSIVSLQGEKKGPSFVARKMKAKSRSFIGDNVLILAPEDIRVEGTTTSITYTKNSYIPSRVYKAILKSALSLLDSSIIKKDYTLAIAYLMGKIDLTGGAIILGYQLPFTLNIPLHVFCFEKKNKNDRIPAHVICFNFQNHLLTIPLPSNELSRPGGGEFDVIIPPPYFINQTMMMKSYPVPFIRDISSNTPVIAEDETITFQVEPGQLENLYCYDPITDTHEQKQFDFKGIKYIVITKEDVTVDPKKLSAFINEQMEGDK